MKGFKARSRTNWVAILYKLSKCSEDIVRQGRRRLLHQNTLRLVVTVRVEPTNRVKCVIIYSVLLTMYIVSVSARSYASFVTSWIEGNDKVFPYHSIPWGIQRTYLIKESVKAHSWKKFVKCIVVSVMWYFENRRVTLWHRISYYFHQDSHCSFRF